MAEIMPPPPPCPVGRSALSGPAGIPELAVDLLLPIRPFTLRPPLIFVAPSFVAAFAAESALETWSNAFAEGRLAAPSGFAAFARAPSPSVAANDTGGVSSGVCVATSGDGGGGVEEAFSRATQPKKLSRMSMNHALVPRMTNFSVAAYAYTSAEVVLAFSGEGYFNDLTKTEFSHHEKEHTPEIWPSGLAGSPKRGLFGPFRACVRGPSENTGVERVFFPSLRLFVHSPLTVY